MVVVGGGRVREALNIILEFLCLEPKKFVVGGGRKVGDGWIMLTNFCVAIPIDNQKKLTNLVPVGIYNSVLKTSFRC